jgi:amidase
MRELGALCQENAGKADPTGSGLLDGLSFAVKDVFDVAGQRTGFGQPTWLATHAAAETTAPAVGRLLAAGARMIARAICDELTYSLDGENVHYGTPLNPACPERIPGGSSSGSASAVAGGLCEFSLGTDCAGSVRIPASFCGLYGMRPTHGRVPLEGAAPFAPSFDTAGWLARDADVLELVGRTLLDERPTVAERQMRPHGLIAQDAFVVAGPLAAAALRPAVEQVSAQLADTEEVHIAEEGLGRWVESFRVIQAFEIWQSLGAWVTEHRPALGPGIRERISWAATVTEESALAERRFRARVVERLDELLGGDGVVIMPTAPGPAPRRGLAPETLDDLRRRAISLLCIAGLGGLPQVTLPRAMLDGCPLGLSLIGPRGSDLLLLQLARRLA